MVFSFQGPVDSSGSPRGDACTAVWQPKEDTRCPVSQHGASAPAQLPRRLQPSPRPPLALSLGSLPRGAAPGGAPRPGPAVRGQRTAVAAAGRLAAFTPCPIGSGTAVLCSATGSAEGSFGRCQTASKQHLLLPLFENRSSSRLFLPPLHF